MNWTQPICDDCWLVENPGREPVRIVPEHAAMERCALCGQPTASGIYVRMDPTKVPYPATDDGGRWVRD